MEYTKKVAEFVAQTTYEDLPAKAIELAKQAILDSVAVTLAGSIEPAAQICAQMAREESTSKDSSVFGQGFKTSCSQAALVNGTAGHALDYDYNFTYMGQPTSCLAAATFALSEKLGRNGRDFLAAYVVGFEVTTKLVCSIPDHSIKEGWHSAGTLGALGAAVACAKFSAWSRGGANDTRDRRLYGERFHLELWDDDQAASCGPRRAERRIGGETGRQWFYRQSFDPRGSQGFS